MEIKEEQKKLTQLLQGKIVKKIMRHRPSEVVIQFLDGSCFIVDIHKGEFEFSVTGERD